MQLTYYASIDALSDSNTTNFVATTHPDVYLYGALKHASIFLMEDERVPLFSQQFEKALEEMRMQQEKAEFAQFMGEFSNAFTQLKSRGHLTIKQKGLEADDLAAWIVGKKKDICT